MKKLLPLFSLLLFSCIGQAQNGCPGCDINLPAGLAEDTIFLAEAPSGQVNVFYDRDISFRLPKTTTPVAAIDSTTPPNLNISSFEIVSVTNLPPGLSWEANQREFNTSQETDGCVKICGTPLIPGLYMVEVVLDAQVVIISQRTSFSFPLLIQPGVTATDGFRMINNVGCGEVDVTFINTIPSHEQEGFYYRWDFGNGLVSEEENPLPLTYDEPGIYEVNYEATIDTSGFFLTKVLIEETSCNDILGGRPDLKIDVIEPDGTTIYTSDIITNASTPLTFELLVPIEDIGNYSLRVTDDDSGIGGADDVCGIVNFTQVTEGSLTDSDDLKVSLTITNPVEVISSKDTVFVYEQPAVPEVEHIAEFPVCAGDTLILRSLTYETGLQWTVDSTSIIGADSVVLKVTENGSYGLRYITPDGCSTESMPVVVSFGVIPSGIAFEIENNLLSVFEPEELPANSSIAWAADGQIIAGADGDAFCIDSTANYSLMVTDEDTGCFATFSQMVTYDPDFPNCVSASTDLYSTNFARVYPNPFMDQLVVETHDATTVPTYFRLVSVTGREIIAGKWRDLPGNGEKKELPVYDLAKGIYILQLFTGRLHQNLKLVKE